MGGAGIAADQKRSRLRGWGCKMRVGGAENSCRGNRLQEGAESAAEGEPRKQKGVGLNFR